MLGTLMSGWCVAGLLGSSKLVSLSLMFITTRFKKLFTMLDLYMFYTILLWMKYDFELYYYSHLIIMIGISIKKFILTKDDRLSVNLYSVTSMKYEKHHFTKRSKFFNRFSPLNHPHLVLYQMRNFTDCGNPVWLSVPR